MSNIKLVRKMIKEAIVTNHVPRFVNELKQVYEKYLGTDGFKLTKIQDGFKFESSLNDTYLGRTAAKFPDSSGGISYIQTVIARLKQKYSLVDVNMNDLSEQKKFVVKITSKK